jgi:protein-disulfide isomerase
LLRQPRTYVLAVAAFSGLTLCFSAFGGTFVNGMMDAAVHAALLRHPEWFAQMSAAAQEQQNLAQSVALRARIAQIAHDPSDPFVGNPASKVTLVEWFDYSCPFCKREHAVVDALIRKDHDVRVVFKEFPIFGSLIPGSLFAAKAALAIWETQPARYLAFHDAMLRDQTPEGSLMPAHVLAIAKSVGCNLADIRREMRLPSIARHVQETMDLGAAVRIDGTPAFVIDRGGGRVQIVSGAVPLDALEASVGA